jgi:hypothetical protein
MKKSIFHAAAGGTAMLTIVTFWTSTVVSELFLGQEAVVAVKHAIAFYGLLPLVLLMAATGGSGFYFAKGRTGRLVEAKKKRMPIIGANGLLVMVPCALFLNSKAAAGEFDTLFYAVQVLELVIGLVQLTLMARSFRDGLRLAGRLVTPESGARRHPSTSS